MKSSDEVACVDIFLTVFGVADTSAGSDCTTTWDVCWPEAECWLKSAILRHWPWFVQGSDMQFYWKIALFDSKGQNCAPFHSWLPDLWGFHTPLNLRAYPWALRELQFQRSPLNTLMRAWFSGCCGDPHHLFLWIRNGLWYSSKMETICQSGVGYQEDCLKFGARKSEWCGNSTRWDSGRMPQKFLLRPVLSVVLAMVRAWVSNLKKREGFVEWAMQK